MTRGKILTITNTDAVWRGLSQIIAVPTPPKGAPADAGHHPINYRLVDFNGDTDPAAPHCASWSYGDRTPTADCIGFALWSSGIDRKQPGYSGASGEWLNCVSLMADARGPKKFCKLVDKLTALLGDWLLTRDHIGLIVRPDNVHGDHLVIDCSPRHGRERAVNTGYPWSEACVVVRPTFYAPSLEAASNYLGAVA